MDQLSRKYFGTDGIRGRVGQTINPDFVLKLGWAAGTVLSKNRGGEVLIGKDTRISGYMLESALEAGFSAAGVKVRLLGPLPTPGTAYLTRTFRALAGVVISASHNLFYDNGIKFFSTQGMKIADNFEDEIEEQLQKPMVIVDSARLGKAVRMVDAAGRYIEFCKSTVPHGMNFSGLKIIIDCAHGATYHVAPNVFLELGAKVIKMGVEPNGLNINESCGSTKPENLRQKVLAEGADLGIALDGDGDRLIMVDHKGEIVDGDELLYIIARYYQQKGRLQGGIVGTVMSNYGFEQALKKLGIAFVRAKVGDRYVMETLQSLGWQLGGEPSGHIVHLALTTTGDGIISALQVVSEMCNTGKSLHELKQAVIKLPQILINVALKNHDDVMQNTLVQKALSFAEQQLGQRGRVLLRVSGTEPVVRVMVEGEDEMQVKNLAQSLAETVQSVVE